jgi:hypothetical protein
MMMRKTEEEGGREMDMVGIERRTHVHLIRILNIAEQR